MSHPVREGLSTVVSPPDPATEEHSSARSPPQGAPTPLPTHRLGDLLRRPASERAREYRYRFGQSLVFGLPVVILQLWGLGLGGPEAAKWVGVFQALLAGWVIYVAAAGMFFEG